MENIVAIAIASVIALNILLQGTHKALESLKDKTASDLDNKAHSALGKILGYLSSIVGFLGNIQK